MSLKQLRNIFGIVSVFYVTFVSHVWASDTKLKLFFKFQFHFSCDVIKQTSRCFMRTATTTLTRTNCAMSTKTTKNIGAMMVLTQQLRTQSVSGLQSSFSASYQQHTCLGLRLKRKDYHRPIQIYSTRWGIISGPSVTFGHSSGNYCPWQYNLIAVLCNDIFVNQNEKENYNEIVYFFVKKRK